MSAEMEMASAGVQIAKNDEPNGEPTCKFYFENNPNRVYYTGQVVNGCVNLTIYEAITVKGKWCPNVATHTFEIKRTSTDPYIIYPLDVRVNIIEQKLFNV